MSAPEQRPRPCGSAPDMVNGHGITHGAFVFAVADTAFACACNSHGPLTVAAAVDITFIAPSHAGDVLEARAVERTRFGRSGIYDVTVRRGDEVVAEFRGTSRTIGKRAARDQARHRAAPELLDAGERLSRDALLDLQLQRLRWSLRHAYAQRPPLPAGIRRRWASRPTTAGSLADLARFPLTTQARSPRQLSVRHVRGAAIRGTPHPCIERDDRAPDGRRLHAGRSRHLGGPHGALHPRRRRAPRRHGPRRLRLRSVHRRSRRPLRRRAPRLHGRPRVRRHDTTPGAADPRLRARRSSW